MGRFTLRRMNLSHSQLTDWGLGHVTIAPHHAILDVGCGGGRTISKLAAMASHGKVFGVDYSADSVTVSKKTNRQAVDAGQVEIQQGSVSQLPFPDSRFDLITAVETHFFWPDLPSDMSEIKRVLKSGGTFIIIAEVYKGATAAAARLVEKHSDRIGLTLLTPGEHRALFDDAGFSDAQVIEEHAKGWICAFGKKPG
jgi:ubiquinone/menaquinone biosynthesis C-methylase UbiE